MSADLRTAHLVALESLLAGSAAAAPVELLIAIGRASRVAHGEDLELAARAEALLESASRGALANLGELAPTPLQRFVDTLAFADDPAASFASVERAGALLAGARAASFDHPALESLAAHIAAAARPAEGESPTHRRRLALALLANQHIADHGVVPGADDAVLTLADAIVPALQGAFRGERLDALLGPEPRPQSPLVTERARALASDELARLTGILKIALDRGDHAKPLAIAASLLELTPFFLATSAPELVLHDDGNEEPILSAEPLPGVLLRVHLDVLEVELGGASPRGGAYPEPVLLPLVGDAALAPCRCRAGQTDRHFVFEPSDHPAVDAYALLIGDEVAVLRA